MEILEIRINPDVLIISHEMLRRLEEIVGQHLPPNGIPTILGMPILVMEKSDLENLREGGLKKLTIS